jgi:hypothetical protein
MDAKGPLATMQTRAIVVPQAFHHWGTLPPEIKLVILGFVFADNKPIDDARHDQVVKSIKHSAKLTDSAEFQDLAL